jgi:hypothetical protein
MLEIDKIDVVPFEIWHGEQIIDYVRDKETRGTLRSSLDIYKHHGVAQTVICGDRVLGAGGAIKLFDGVAEGWTLMPEDSGEYPRIALKYGRIIMSTCIEVLGLHRMQATCRVDLPAAKIWAKHLKFKYEGTLKQYSMDRVDCDIYAWVKE